jgi:hypothetical protein
VDEVREARLSISDPSVFHRRNKDLRYFASLNMTPFGHEMSGDAFREAKARLSPSRFEDQR